jgi:hypothetical protein
MASLVHYFGLNLPISESPRCLSSAPAASSVAIQRRKWFLDRMRRRCKSTRWRTVGRSSFVRSSRIHKKDTEQRPKSARNWDSF